MITITGTSGSLTATTTVSLTVNAAPAPSFTLAASPGSLSVVQGGAGTSTITVTPQNGFSGSVALSATGVPAGVTASFNPTSTSSPSSSSTLTLAASGTATTGTATITVSGTSGSLAGSTTISLTVTATTAPSTLPSPWTDQDIGSVGTAGSASYSNGTFTVSGAGAQIYGSAHAFNFVYQPLTGNGTIIARVVSVTGASTFYTAAGVMIRNTLDAGSANAKTAEWPDFKSIYFDLRSSSGSTTTEPGGTSAAAPYWVKVSRSGNTFSSYVSKDGVTWVQLSSGRTITMNQIVYVGLAVVSGSTTALSSATFDNVSVTQP